jgi:hypothetical protein
LVLTDKQSEELGKLMNNDITLLRKIGWKKFVEEKRGQSDLHSGVRDLPHPANEYLDHLRRFGAKVTMKTAPWTRERAVEALQRGPHKSSEEYADFLAGEMVEFMQRGQWVVLPASELLNDPILARHLRISPMGVVPQRDRRPRVIVDYSWSGVNDETLKLSHQEAMQFGKALQRILQDIVSANPLFGPVSIIKVDIADGFYRISVNPDDIPKLAVAIPQLCGDEPLLALPLVLPMGWTESPPYFCGGTETATDIINSRLHNHWVPPPHHLDAVADTPPPVGPPGPSISTPLTAEPVPVTPPAQDHHKRPLAKCDVFVDDLIALGQGQQPALTNLRRVLFHTLDEVFRPLEPGDKPTRQEPASVKKLRKGDGFWETRKLVLGWILDTLRMTIELPPHRLERLEEILNSIPRTQKRTSVRKWQQVLGELRSMAIAIPGSHGMFSLLQEALRRQADKRLRLSRGVHDCLDDFRWLFANLSERPTRLYELVPQPEPVLLGAGDACGRGMGGVWFPVANDLSVRGRDGAELRGADSAPLSVSSRAPLVWRAEFPPEVVRRLITTANPTGTITNSDLELAATIVQRDVAAHCYDIRERTISNGSDNISAVCWQRKGSTTTTSAPAYLLRLQAIHQRHHRYLARDFYIPGPVNVMSDDASRLLSLTPPALVSHFNSSYPQTTSWRFVQPRPEILSSVTSALLSKRPAVASFCQEPTPTITPGSSGATSVSSSTWTPSSLMWGTQSSYYKSLGSATERAKSPPAVDVLSLAQWRAPSAPWARGLKAWGPPIRATTPSAE